VVIRVRRSGEWIAVPLPEQVKDLTVHHYTNADGLLGIVNSSHLWASSPLALNDSSEVTFGLDLVRHIWGAIPSDHLSVGQHALMGQVLDSLDGIKEAVYLLSASREGDLLNQWQGYSGRQGYCLGIDTAKRLAVLEPEDAPEEALWRSVGLGVNPGWYSVLYDETDQIEAARRLLTYLVEDMPDPTDSAGIDRFAHHVTVFVGTLAGQLKHGAFAAEQEVRYIAPKGVLFPEKFRAGPFGLVPYVELAAAPRSEDYLYVHPPVGVLPLVGLTCGPANEPEKSAVAATAGRFLRARGYNIEVTTSEVPYRF
jgi:hypothetical protein